MPETLHSLVDGQTDEIRSLKLSIGRGALIGTRFPLSR